MMHRLQKILIASSLCTVFSAAYLSAQQITKFGVVDTAKVYNAYFRNSSAVRNYERKKAEYQEEINKRTEEIRALQQKKLSYEDSGDESNAVRIESQITQKTEYKCDALYRIAIA